MFITGTKALVKTALTFTVTISLFKLSCSSSSSPPPPVPPSSDPLLLRAARGEPVERSPVWMMRQAGRHMKAYRDLTHQYPTFRERSETPHVSLRISLQPSEAYGVDGVILFSDILTPLPAMGIEFDISEKGGISIEPIRDHRGLMRLRRVTSLNDYEEMCPFVGDVIRKLRKSVPSYATVLGFVGLPFTLATYLIEGKTAVATGFKQVKSMRDNNPNMLHDMLSLLAHNIAIYAHYQIESGAQVIQVFDSWAGHLEDDDYDVFCAPYQKSVIESIKSRYPHVPVIIYMAPGDCSSRGRRLTRLALTGADIVSVDHTVDMALARELVPEPLGLQGNLDPVLLRDGPLEEIVVQTRAILDKVKGRRHIMNLGHGIQPDTPEEHAALFVKTVQGYSNKL